MNVSQKTFRFEKPGHFIKNQLRSSLRPRNAGFSK